MACSYKSVPLGINSCGLGSGSKIYFGRSKIPAQRYMSTPFRIRAVKENEGPRRLIDIIRIIPEISRNYFRSRSRRALFGGISLLDKKKKKKEKATTGISPKIFSPFKIMDQPELSLGPSLSSFPDCTNSSSSESEANNRRKRKLSSWLQPSTQTSIDLQLNNPLPVDWEQCLDLQSGRMYYLNRKTLKKSLLKPREQKLDLDLNISSLPDSENNKDRSLTTEDTTKHSSCSKGGSAMVAIVCLNCHLLVMLYRSSPSCPNCKYMHLLLPSPAPKKETVKSLETLSLLH